MIAPEAPAARPPEGRVITFYSYKGGTGRSMTLANVAWILASNGKRVLAVDWDVEAPGLHRYFAPFLLDPDLTATPGLMDLLVDFATETVCGSPDAPRDWHHEYAGRVLRHVVSLEWRFAGSGTLDLLPAGRQGPQYAPLVNGFNWQHFYDKQGGGVFIDAVKERLRGLYDYVLVDSRTGVSDTSGICTVQLPDTLVACFTLNNQGIEGAAAVAASAFQQRQKDGGLRVLPVPMRIENAENSKLQARWELAKRRLAPFPVLKGVERDKYWSEVAATYKPFYAYEEILATFGDRPTDPIPLLPSAERLAFYLTDGEVEALVPPDEEKRLAVLARYASVAADPDGPARDDAAAEAVFALLTPAQQAEARWLLIRLVEVLPREEGGGVRRARLPLEELDEEGRGVALSLVNAGLLSEDRNTPAGPVVQMADEALPMAWGRLRGWIEADQEFLVWRRRLAVQVAEWDGGGRERAALLRGSKLKAAEKWLKARPADFHPTEAEYIKASAAGARADRVRLAAGVTVVAWGLLGVLLQFTSPSQWSFWRSNPPPDTAARSALVADARRLSDQGVYGPALILLDSAVRLDSLGFDASVARGNTRLRAGQVTGASQDFTRVANFFPRLPDGYVGLADVQLARGDTAAAITLLRTAYALVDSPVDRDSLSDRLRAVGSRPVDRSVEVLGYAASPGDSLWLRSISRELERIGYPLSRPWTPTRNNAPRVRFFRDSRGEAADSICAAIQRNLLRRGIPMQMWLVKADSSLHRVPPGSITISLPSARVPGSRPMPSGQCLREVEYDTINADTFKAP
jgi:tetratricopeptide (TPR) repeat protein